MLALLVPGVGMGGGGAESTTAVTVIGYKHGFEGDIVGSPGLSGYRFLVGLFRRLAWT